MIPADDARNAAWVRARLDELDTTPRNRNWRYRAVGMTVSEALAEAPRDVKIDLKIPVGEWRLINEAAKRREIAVPRFIRRSVGTMLHVCEGLPIDAMPYLLDEGLIGPR